MSTTLQSAGMCSASSPVSSATHNWRVIAGAVVFIICSIQFIVGERIAASAWKHPAYSYSNNYISDLGVTISGDKPAKSLNPNFTQAGQILTSPKHGFMNASFVLLGVLFFVGTLLMMPLLEQSAGRVQVGMAVLFAACLTTVGLVHAQSQTGKAIIFHVLGAFVGICLGNLATIRVGGFSRSLGAPHWFSTGAVILGAFGLISGVLIAVPSALLTPPIWERCSAYSLVLALFGIGCLVIYGELAGKLMFIKQGEALIEQGETVDSRR